MQLSRLLSCFACRIACLISFGQCPMYLFSKSLNLFILLLAHTTQFVVGSVNLLVPIFLADFLAVFLLVINNHFLLEPFKLLSVSHTDSPFMRSNCLIHIGDKNIQLPSSVKELLTVFLKRQNAVKCR
ncbi:hypothetical protein D3C77_377280 [compost metagenome]